MNKRKKQEKNFVKSNTSIITIPLHSVGIASICLMKKRGEIMKEKMLNLCLIYASVVRRGTLSYKSIEMLTGLSRPTIKRHIKFLKEKNILSVQTRKDKKRFLYTGKSGKQSIYTYNLPNIYKSLVDKSVSMFKKIKNNIKKTYSHLRDFFLENGTCERKKGRNRLYYDCPSCGEKHKVVISGDGEKGMCTSCNQGFHKDGVGFFHKEKREETFFSISRTSIARNYILMK